MNILDYIISGIVVGVFLAINGLRYHNKWKLKKRLRRAKKGEQKAIDLMKNYGFNVVDLQKKESYTLFIDDKPREVSVKADMIVKKGRNTYVAEVKTGEKVTSPTYPNTRRQLLEYYMVYRPKGLLLVDMEKRKIRKIEYSILKKDFEGILNRTLWLVLAFVGGFIIGFLIRGG